MKRDTTITLNDIDPVLAYRVRERIASAPDGVGNDVRAILDQRGSAESAVGQPLASLHTSAAHARLAPGLAAAAAGGGLLPQVEAEEAVAEIQRQTRAVEQAVAEVAALRAGSGQPACR